MATPVAHGIVGAAVWAFGDRRSGRRSVELLGACLFLSLAPDLDFIPGLLSGDVARYHQGISHSLAFALAAAALGSGALAVRGHAAVRTFALLFLAYASHLALDMLGFTDSRPPFGVPLLWPLTDAVLQSPVRLLPGVQHETLGSGRDWLLSLFQPFNVLSVLLEAVLTAPFLAVALRRRGRRRAS